MLCDQCCSFSFLSFQIQDIKRTIDLYTAFGNSKTDWKEPTLAGEPTHQFQSSASCSFWGHFTFKFFSLQGWFYTFTYLNVTRGWCLPLAHVNLSCYYLHLEQGTLIPNVFWFFFRCFFTFTLLLPTFPPSHRKRLTSRHLMHCENDPEVRDPKQPRFFGLKWLKHVSSLQKNTRDMRLYWWVHRDTCNGLL